MAENIYHENQSPGRKRRFKEEKSFIIALKRRIIARKESMLDVKNGQAEVVAARAIHKIENNPVHSDIGVGDAFDEALVALTKSADTMSCMTLELGEDLARIAAMRERIDRQNKNNAKALQALLQGRHE